jgi:hypothetical protein
MRQRRRSIRRRNKHIIPLLAPPVMPFRLIRLPPRNQLPILVRRLGRPRAQQPSPDGVALHVPHPEVMRVLDEARQLHVEPELGGARIVLLEGAEGRGDGGAAVGA